MEAADTEHGGSGPDSVEDDDDLECRAQGSSAPDVTTPVEQWTTYRKTSGHANMTGELFEVKMAALLYVRGVATFVRADRLLPASLDKALKTKMKLRLAWLLLLLVPVWAYASATVQLSWARWLGMLVAPLPVFTLFFEWGRHQLLMTDRKT